MLKKFTGGLILILSLLLTGVNYAQTTLPKETSVLNNGQWFKLGITSTGIYKIDRNLLQAAGIAADAINPKNIKVYGNGGGMLPQLNSTPRPDDLVENAILVSGEADGKFDANDYILFYGQGPHRWTYDPNSKRFRHAFNIYADTAYYFITVGTTPGRRVSEQTAVTNSTVTIDTYLEHQFYEKDLISPLQSGREWYGEDFTAFTPTRNFTFPITNLVPGSPIQITSAVMGSSRAGSEFVLKANNIAVGNQSINGQGTHNYHPVGEDNLTHFTLNSNSLQSGAELTLNIAFNNKGVTDAIGYLNYLEVTSERYLKFSGNQIAFRSLQNILPSAVSTFKIENITPETIIWDVTQATNPQVMVLQKQNNTATFNVKTDTLREFISFRGSDFPKPALAGKVANQNLHALNVTGTLDLVILTHPAFVAAAEKLANHRRTRDNLNVAVVTVNQVYNEFSSGATDVTAIRDFMKMLYNRSKKPAGEVIYLLLFGDASYDYKSPPGQAQTRTPFNTNFVPVYESRQSLNPLRSYSSEDYFGLLDPHEGLWLEENFNTSELIDIGIGRLPAKTLTEAQTLVNKLIHYDSPAGFGNWRNQITFLADDGDGAEHLRDAENLANYLEENQPAYHAKKVYLDLFKQTTVPNGQRSPETNTTLDKTIEKGTLLLNYTGHGNEISLAHEQILTMPQLQNWKNYDQLTFMLTATCEFGRYDDPRRSSGAEVALLNNQGGAMGLLSTTRPVYARDNRLLNRHFFENLFTPINGRMPRLGDLYRITKNKSQNQINNRNFTLLGDPSQKLAYPALKAIITQINKKPVSTGITDTLKALSDVIISGAITDADENLITSFNGQVSIKIFDKPAVLKTFGDEGTPGAGNIQAVAVQENILYNGLATVKNGVFTVNFKIPKDIAYPIGKGKISLYAFNNVTDALGANTTVAVGGSHPNPAADTTPPTIKLYLDDESFVAGGLTSNTPQLLVKLSDESGINTTTTGIGHEITLTLDNNNAQAIILNEFYTTEKDNFKAGRINYLLPNLAPGPHELKIKAWDIYNNSSEARLPFVVAGNQNFVIENIQNYPNPFANQTTFGINHNQAGDEVEIQIQVFNLMGQLVKTIREKRDKSKNRIADITWNGKDDAGNKLVNGVYLYKVKIRSLTKGIWTEQAKKLMILN
ncbi:type IX secretion system sortase PorU [Adhaeribacter rhizoryzae]|uniref:Type IX secretion system sortase PorU n=1 Tax=Adhaeribacter rhizoryzae TaxID=2607907 RepID=A0A5M6DIN3_9BACT|nr:type IX secretion system sortase PorU [Adhaeribacter rhizoryzae]KAA5547424.1 type IX secretion system sortase PorU [Adhaeribacter rhizoryzae]